MLNRLNRYDILNVSVIFASLLVFYFFQEILPEMSQPGHLTSDSKVDGVRLSPKDKWPTFETLSPWPVRPNGRPVSGGQFDGMVIRPLKPLESGLAKDLLIRVDGSVHYRSKNWIEFRILLKNRGNTIEYIIPAENGIDIDMGVPHSHPFGEKAEEFVETVRPTNGIVLAKNYKPLEERKGEQTKLDPSFTEGKLVLEEATINAAYDVVLQSTVEEEEKKFRTPTSKIVSTWTPADWPYLDSYLYESEVHELSQEFTMEWMDEGENKEIFFKGLSGHLAGNEGRPGVVYNKKENTISVDLLLCRPDGSFFISTDDELVMIVAQSDANGEPIKSTLEAITFKNGVKLPAGWWHSVPFPPRDRQKIFLYEKIAASEANIGLDVRKETGSPMIIQL